MKANDEFLPRYIWGIICLDELRRLSPAKPCFWSVPSSRRGHPFSISFRWDACRQHGKHLWIKCRTWHGLTCILSFSNWCAAKCIWTRQNVAKCNGSRLSPIYLCSGDGPVYVTTSALNHFKGVSWEFLYQSEGEWVDTITYSTHIGDGHDYLSWISLSLLSRSYVCTKRTYLDRTIGFLFTTTPSRWHQ